MSIEYKGKLNGLHLEVAREVSSLIQVIATKILQAQ